jgi:glycine cleavage system aminomethyltransferase T
MSELKTCYNLPSSRLINIWDAQVPKLFSSIEKEVHAIRYSAAISDVSHTTSIRLSGSHAFDVLDRITPCHLNLKNNSITHTLFILDESLHYADVYIGKEPEAYLLIIKGESPGKIAQWIGKHKNDDEIINIEVLNETHSQIAFNGPFAWEILSELEEPEIISLPYLSFYCPDGARIIARCGETGEFGYLLIYPHEVACQIWQAALTKGGVYDLEMAGYEALDYCALENNTFNVTKEGSIGVNPRELQLQWRISYQKQFIYRDVLEKIREEPLQRRLTAIFSDSPFYEKEKIYYDQREIGFIVNAYRFLSGNGYIGLAMLDRPYAESGIPYYNTQNEAQSALICTVSPPFINNYSLVVNPQIHSYMDKDEIKYPPLTYVKSE